MPDPSGLTVCMIVRDEHDNLRELLPVLAGAADDIVVVDTGSIDESAELARSLGARVFEHPWDDHFSHARNRGLDEVHTSHVLWLDADDRITADDLARLRAEALARGGVGLAPTLVSESPNPQLTSTCRQLRVFPARAEHRFEGRIHEQIQPALDRTGTPIEPVDVTIRHLGYDTDETIVAKSRRNLALCRLEWEAGLRGAAAAYQYAHAASLCGEPEEGARLLAEFLSAPPADAPEDVVQNLRVLRGRFLHQLGRADEAADTYADAVRRHPNDPWARWHLGELLMNKGRAAQAVKHLEVATKAAPLSERVPLPIAGLRAAAGEALVRCRAAATGSAFTP